MSFQHLIISRFNVGLYPSEEAASWMDYRLKIFDYYCYPSIASQTNQNFTWLVLFDSRTSEKHRKIISKYKKVTPVYYVRKPGSLQTIVKESIKKSVNPKAEFIITTRVDVDDMLNKDFVKETQIQMPKKDNVQLVFSLGYVLRLHPNILLEREYIYNQFASYIEKNSGNIKTVWFAAHGTIHKTAETKCINKDRMWCWTLHNKHLGRTSKIKNYRLKTVNVDLLQRQFVYKKGFK